MDRHSTYIPEEYLLLSTGKNPNKQKNQINLQKTTEAVSQGFLALKYEF